MLRNLGKLLITNLTTNPDDLKQTSNKDMYMLACLLSAVKFNPYYLAPSTEEIILANQPIHIRLTNDLLTMYGRPEDSAGVVLRGRVFVNLTKYVDVKAITVIFKGTLNIYSPIEQIYREKRFIEKQINLGNTWVDTQTWNSWNQFDFELPLSGDLPSSIHTERVKIQYQVMGVIERLFLCKNEVAHSPVVIQRSTCHENFEADVSTTFSGVWASLLCYEVFTPDLTFIIGTSIPLSFKLFVLVEGLRLHYVQLVLEEKILYQEEEFLFPTYLKEKVNCINISCPNPHGHSWEDTVFLPISTSAHEDCDSAFVDISHSLLVNFVISVPNTGKNIIFGRIPVRLISSTQAEASSPLPLYEP